MKGQNRKMSVLQEEVVRAWDPSTDLSALSARLGCRGKGGWEENSL